MGQKEKVMELINQINGIDSNLDKKTILDTARGYILDRMRETLKISLEEFNEFRSQLAKAIRDDLKNIDSFIDRDIRRIIYPQANFWLEDELILTFPKDEERIQALIEAATNDRDVLIKGGPGDRKLQFDIAFKDEFKNDSKNANFDQISLVVQCMFVVCYENGVLFALHDRSYSGAEDRLSKYALITGRLSVSDLDRIANGKISVSQLCLKNALHRELQEIDELGLSQELAHDYTHAAWIEGTNTPRSKFIGVYRDKRGKVLSFLHAIFVTIEEFNQKLTNRGPYLIPVTPQEFTRLKTLNLLNDILDKNSCDNCFLNEDDIAENFQKANENRRCKNCLNESARCIMWDIVQKSAPISLKQFKGENLAAYAEDNISRYRTRLEHNAAIVAIDIPQYSQLKITAALDVREQLEKLIYSFLPFRHMDSDRRHFHVLPTSTGFIVVLFKPDDHRYPSLVAYFFSLYLNMQFTKLKQRYQDQAASIRIGLHTDSLKPSLSFSNKYFLGDGVNKTLQIVNFCNEGQILCSQNFAFQMLTELDAFGTPVGTDTDEDLRYLTVKKTQLLQVNPQFFWNANDLWRNLEQLAIPPVVVMEISQDKSILACFENYGLPIQNFGFFTEDKGHRQRIFNLGIFNPEDEQDDLPSKPARFLEYGNSLQPVAKIPFITRNKLTTVDEMEKLVESMKYAQHLTLYGYSNIRLLKEMYKKHCAEELQLESLVEMNIIFYDYEQYRHINETKSIDLTRADWIRGFLYAHQLADELKDKDIKIKINTTRYGFNVFKVIYASDAPIEYQDHIRFTVPMPGKVFELSPLFKISRGDALYHGFLEICEHYIEQGIKENSKDISVRQYFPTGKSKEYLDELFGANKFHEDINGVPPNSYQNLISRDHPQQPEEAKEIEKKLGSHYKALLGEGNYQEAYRLWWCLQKLEEFDYHDFLKKFEG